jgi:hypothetical protein
MRGNGTHSGRTDPRRPPMSSELFLHACKTFIYTSNLHVDQCLIRDVIGHDNIDQLMYLAVDVAMVLNWAWLIATQATHEPFIPLCKSSQALMLESNPLPREWPLSFFCFLLVVWVLSA